MTATAAACLAALREFFAGESGKGVLDWGIAPARPTPRSDLLRAWIAEGRHAGMGYMAARLAERADPRVFHPWAVSAVVFAMPYARPLSTGGRPGAYRVAAYARGADYHASARRLLAAAEAHLRSREECAAMRFYGFVDTAPVFERDLASEAGLGWRAKNCCTLNRKTGSAFHLAGFFLDVELPRSEPLDDFCGGCTRCLDACPTGAFVGPGKLDAGKCISYWTIEAKGSVPEDLSRKFGGWIFGCDICQEVCPWNRKHLEAAPTGRSSGGDMPDRENPMTRLEPEFPADGPAWAALLRKGGGFQSRFRHTPLMRAGRRAMLRNLAISARNLGDRTLAEPLRGLMEEETDPALLAEIRRTLVVLDAIPLRSGSRGACAGPACPGI